MIYIINNYHIETKTKILENHLTCMHDNVNGKNDHKS